MKKVLIITYYWPPSGGGGVQRWVKFVKYLRSFDWEPIVFTPENPEMPAFDESLLKDIPASVQVIKSRIWEPYSFYKKFTGKKSNEKIQTAFLNEKKSSFSILEKISLWIRSNFFIPDARLFWVKPSVNKISKLLKEYPVDAVVTTGPPHSIHLIGLKLKKELNIKWLADFRDPWTNIDYYGDLILTKKADQKHRIQEKGVLTHANAVTVISPGMKQDFLSIKKREYHVIPNGFDRDDVETIQVNKSEKFCLAHIGSLTKTRNPLNLWKALKEIVETDNEFANKLEILNIGKLDYSVKDSIESSGLLKYLNQVDYKPHNEVILDQKRATILLLLINNTPSSKLILTGKIFEYLASGTPIICIAPSDGDAANVIRETSSGLTFDFDEINELKKSVLDYFRKFNEETVISDKRSIDKYDRKNLTKSLSEILNNL